MGHHAERGDGSDEVSRILRSIRNLLGHASGTNLKNLYVAVCKSALLGYVDPLLAGLAREFGDGKGPLAAIGRVFVLEAPRREAVKFGIAVLGIAGNQTDLDTLRSVGRSDEFTLFTAVAIQNLSVDPDRELLELAKTVEGWGRIHLVERLAKTENFEIRSWLLREGFRNAVMNEYLACICARAGKLHEALRANPQDQALVTSATDIISAMINGGPAEDIDAYEHAAEAIEAYLDAVWPQPGNSPKRFILLDRIRKWLNCDDGWEERTQCGWNPASRERCLLMLQQILGSENWKSSALLGLESSDDGEFYWANLAARRLGVDTWHILFAKVTLDPIGSRYWYELTEATGDSRVDRLIEFAERAIPLDRIATGPADEMGLGEGFEAHSTLDWMLQLLDRFPGKGWPLIRAGLQSPVVRNRNWSLRVFKNWSRQDWPSDARVILQTAVEREPDEDLKKDLQTCLSTG
jgi:hypothetical protein